MLGGDDGLNANAPDYNASRARLNDRLQALKKNIITTELQP